MDETELPLSVWRTFPGGRIEERFKALFLFSGTQQFLVDGKSVRLTAPQALCLHNHETVDLPAGTKVQVVTFLPELINGSLTLERLWGCPHGMDVSAELDRYWTDVYLGTNRSAAPVRLSAPTAQKLEARVGRLDHEVTTRSCRFWKAWARSYLSEILFALGEVVHGESEPALTLAQRAAELLRRDYGCPELTLAKVCRELGTNKTTLQKEFRLALGRTVGQYLRAYRLSVARDLLESDQTITEVAWAVGFLDLTGFERAFLRHYGVPPRDYRKRSAGRNFLPAEKSFLFAEGPGVPSH